MNEATATHQPMIVTSDDLRSTYALYVDPISTAVNAYRLDAFDTPVAFAGQFTSMATAVPHIRRAANMHANVDRFWAKRL